MNSTLQIAYAAKQLSREVARAALSGRTGAAGGSTATGDQQKSLDVYSNEIIIDAMDGLGVVSAVASEELDDLKILNDNAGGAGGRAPYLLVMDPLDGSSNTDNHGAVGTIFGIYETCGFRESLTNASSREALASLGGRAPVANLHRTILEGGIYLYPADPDHKEGKLRQLYECAPLAFVVENAGGRASTGYGRVLDAPIRSLHQRSQFFVGSAEEVLLCERFLAG